MRFAILAEDQSKTLLDCFATFRLSAIFVHIFAIFSPELSQGLRIAGAKHFGKIYQLSPDRLLIAQWRGALERLCRLIRRLFGSLGICRLVQRSEEHTSELQSLQH